MEKKNKKNEISHNVICKAARLLKGETLDEHLLERYKLIDSRVRKYPRLKTNVIECNEQCQIDVT